jgi:uncharacterized membrane protein YdjX (TVP38/TMEM64 family)
VAPIADTLGFVLNLQHYANKPRYTACYFLVSFFMRSWVLQKVDDSKILKAVLFAVDRNPIKFTILLRLTPITLGMQNALLSVCFCSISVTL